MSWSHQNVVGALRSLPTDPERYDTLAAVLIELFADDAERAVCQVAAALHAVRDANVFDPTVYGKVLEAIWPEVSESAAFLTYAAEFVADDSTYSEVEDEAIHDLVWAVIERSDEVEDADDAICLAHKIMADQERHNHPEED
jgi:hypothetical protein